MKVYSLTIRNPVAALVVGLGVAGAAVAAAAVGVVLLAGVVVAGGVLGAGLVGYRRLRGGRGEPRVPASRRTPGLDPGLEVFAERRPAPGGADRALPNDESKPAGPPA